MGKYNKELKREQMRRYRAKKKAQGRMYPSYYSSVLGINTMYIRQYKESHPCVDCGNCDPDVLEFDHVKGEKVAAIATMAIKNTLDEVIEEISKCVVRCANCHRKRHARKRQANSW